MRAAPAAVPVGLAWLLTLFACVAPAGDLDGGDLEGGSGACAPACAADQVCQAGDCVPLDGEEDPLQRCADVVNGYRAQAGRAALTRSDALERFAAEAAAYDAERGQAHAYFIATQGGGVAYAENEIPGWPLGADGSVLTIIDEGTAMMWAEGPGGGHYDNMVGNYTEIGCGVFITAGDFVWVAQDFR
jgi:uncharacterized protein YkwD